MKFNINPALSKIKKGQALVELAITLPVFLFLFITLIDGARFMNLQANLNRLAALGAHHGIQINQHFTYPNNDEIKKFIYTKHLPPLSIQELKRSKAIEINNQVLDAVGMTSLKVKINYNIGFSSPFLVPIFGKTYKVTGQAILPFLQD